MPYVASDNGVLSLFISHWAAKDTIHKNANTWKTEHNVLGWKMSSWQLSQAERSTRWTNVRPVCHSCHTSTSSNNKHMQKIKTCNANTHIYTHTRLTAIFPGLPGWAGTIKVKAIWISLKQETVSDSGISWAICKSAPRSRQITTPAPHHSVFTGRMPFLLPNQQR